MSRDKIFGRIGSQPPRPPSIAMDRLGRVIEQGHLVMFHSDVDLVFEVVDVRPVLDPSQPGGVMQMTLRSEFNVGSPSGSVNRMTVIVGESQARLATKAANNGKPSQLEAAYMEATEGDPPPPESIVTSDPTDKAALECQACGYRPNATLTVAGIPCTECGDGVYRPVQD